jgi:hypothetical protein
MFSWNKRLGNYNQVVFCGEKIKFDLATDAVIEEIDEPASGCDRIRESLRKNADGVYYLHTDSDREDECINSRAGDVQIWASEHGIEI